MNEIIRSFGLDPARFEIQRIPAGYIHDTYKLAGKPSYILQRVNKNVFRQPDIIAANLRLASDYLKERHPEYLFLSSLPTVDGKGLSYDSEGYPWRLFAFIENSITINAVTSAQEAYNASAAFAKLTCMLEGADVSLFRPTIDRFHDLNWRYEQFEESIANGRPDRRVSAADLISGARDHKGLVDQYRKLTQGKLMKLRITHNDTKINNVLLDARTKQAVCVIDLDTLMPGYFIYDVGDMMRTFVSPANEEEKDLSKVEFRKNIYDAVVEGYLSQMGGILSDEEKRIFPFAGKMMTYIMALRMLTDYLNGDVYYRIIYPEQNYVRARNQLRMLEVLSAVI